MQGEQNHGFEIATGAEVLRIIKVTVELVG